ncbi:ribosomal protein S6 kinase delta-1 isoform X3 [Erinaceus europaeus]|uniref:Ribosomal protein S6 kinase delta-1 isoform X3 n=1 Tax=Erinaceus europaeus TaxID=9365 RepID=A0ABM3WCT7_ERIEU|nr:ribosomal protein S6 kinase delta-1 isoform X3 [Erinaceus europaeus]
MSSPWGPGADLARFYTVTDPRRHPRGYTVYRVTARVVSRRNPEEVQEITVWKRYSDFKKLHRELWEIHRHLSRHSELFPPFAKGIVFGRFGATVIEERRQCAEDLLQFSANIPALHSSRQLRDFFKGGVVQDGSELIGPAEVYPEFPVHSCAESSTQGFSRGADRAPVSVDAESPAEPDDGMASDRSSPAGSLGLSSAFPSAPPPPPGEQSGAEEEREGRRFPGSRKAGRGHTDYLEAAAELVSLALRKEDDAEYAAASGFYRDGVHLLLEGVQGESSPTRREAVKRRTAEYLTRAESLSRLCGKPQCNAAPQPPGSLSSRPPWNLRSPAEELKAFRVLGVIDKVLLVMDTRTEQTFILKGLRKSSGHSGNRKTVIPRRVPNMVCLHKYMESEEGVFLVLQHAEGGKLWSYISKFLHRSPEDSFATEEVRAPARGRVPQDSSSFGSRGSEAGAGLGAVPLKASLTPSSQDGSGAEDEGRADSPQWPDSGSSSEEGCTTSYLTLCTEYGQEKVGPGSLEEELCPGTSGDRAAADSLPAPWHPRAACRAPQRAPSPWDDDPACSPRSSESLWRLRNSPMEFFRIDSKDSTSELLGLDFGDKLCSLRPEPPRPLFPLADGGGSPACPDTCSRSSDDSVPTISFKDAAFEDACGADEGRPDLLVNLPGDLEPSRDWVAEGPAPSAQTDSGRAESKLWEAPDVLCLRLRADQSRAPEEEVGVELIGAPGTRATSPAEGASAPGEPVAAESLSHGPDLRGLPAVQPATSTAESSLGPPSGLPGARGCGQEPVEVRLFAEPAEEPAFQGRPEIGSRSGPPVRGDGEIHQLFEDLDKKLALSSRLHIPEGCIQRWAAEMVVALDALHREGIVCRDLNPNNILLNDREVGAITGETEACDWWSLGAVLFELLTGKTLVECHPAGITTHTTLNMPEYISEEARSLIQQTRTRVLVAPHPCPHRMAPVPWILVLLTVSQNLFSPCFLHLVPVFSGLPGHCVLTLLLTHVSVSSSGPSVPLRLPWYWPTPPPHLHLFPFRDSLFSCIWSAGSNCDCAVHF